MLYSSEHYQCIFGLGNLTIMELVLSLSLTRVCACVHVTFLPPSLDISPTPPWRFKENLSSKLASTSKADKGTILPIIVDCAQKVDLCVCFK